MSTQDQNPTQEQELNREVIKNPNEEWVEFETPVTFGGQTHKGTMVRKPGVMALSGVSLQDLYRSDVNTFIKVIPLCTSPSIPREVLTTMTDPIDLAQMGGQIVYFLQPKSIQEAINIQQSTM